MDAIAGAMTMWYRSPGASAVGSSSSCPRLILEAVGRAPSYPSSSSGTIPRRMARNPAARRWCSRPGHGHIEHWWWGCNGPQGRPKNPKIYYVMGCKGIRPGATGSDLGHYRNQKNPYWKIAMALKGVLETLGFTFSPLTKRIHID